MLRQKEEYVRQMESLLENMKSEINEYDIQMKALHQKMNLKDKEIECLRQSQSHNQSSINKLNLDITKGLTFIAGFIDREARLCDLSSSNVANQNSTDSDFSPNRYFMLEQLLSDKEEKIKELEKQIVLLTEHNSNVLFSLNARIEEVVQSSLEGQFQIERIKLQKDLRDTQDKLREAQEQLRMKEVEFSILEIDLKEARNTKKAN